MIHIDWHNIDNFTSLPISYRFIDRATIEEGKKIEGVKAVSSLDWYFQMHFPGNPMMPGVFFVEMMKQNSELLISSMEDYQGKHFKLHSCYNMRIFCEVRPGAILMTQVFLVQKGNAFLDFSGIVYEIDSKSNFQHKICSMDFCLAENIKADVENKSDKIIHEVLDAKIEENDRTRMKFLDYRDLEQYIADPLPYRFVDKVNIFEKKLAISLNNISSQDWYFNFCDEKNYNLPIAFMMETLMQTGVFIVTTIYENNFRLMLFNSCKKFRLYRQPHIGESIENIVKLMMYRNGVAKYKGVSRCGDEIVSSMEWILVAPDDMIPVRR